MKKKPTQLRKKSKLLDFMNAFYSRFKSTEMLLLTVSGIIVGITSGYLGEQAVSVIDNWHHFQINWYKVWASLICLMILPVGITLGILSVRKILVPRTRRLTFYEPPQRKALVLFLSVVRNPKWVASVKDSGPDHPVKLISFSETAAERNLSGQSIRDDLNAMAKAKRQNLGPPINWEQALRGIYHHSRDAGPLERLIVIASPESVVQADMFFGKFVSRYLELKGVKFELLLSSDNRRSGIELVASDDISSIPVDKLRNRAWDFEDLNALSNGIVCLFEHLNDGPASVPDNQIVVDYTGGMKVCSVVSAMTTLNRDIETQYVATQEREVNRGGDHELWEYDVLGYDLVVDER